MCKVNGINRTELTHLRQLMMYKFATGRWIHEIVRNPRGEAIVDPRTKKPMTRKAPEIIKQYLIDKAGNFPTGLLYIAIEHFVKSSMHFKINDTRIAPRKRHSSDPTRFLPGTCPTPYPEQKAAAAAAYEQGRGIISAPTGSGKSIIAALICDAFQVKTVIVVPKLALKDQLTESFKAFFGEDQVGPLVKGKCKKWITIENIDAMKKADMDGVDLVLIDEFHHAGAAGYRTLNQKKWNGVYFKIGLTATPFRSRTEERLLLESVLSKVIYRLTYSHAVRLGFIVPVEAYYYRLPITEKVKARSWAGVYKELVVEHEYRNKLIAHLAGNLIENEISTLILTKQVNHGERIQDLLDQRNITAPFAEGKKGAVNKDLIADFNDRFEFGLIGTNGILGEGVDSRPAEFVIIGGLGKSKNQLMQQIGRVLRKFPSKETGKVILFYDESHRWTISHFEAQVKVLREEYGIEPVELEYEP